MVEFKATFTEVENLNADFVESKDFKADFGEVTKASTSDYNELYNKPKIDGVTLQGNKTHSQIGIGLVSEQDIDTIIYGG